MKFLEHTLPLQVRLMTKLLAGEAKMLCLYVTYTGRKEKRLQGGYRKKMHFCMDLRSRMVGEKNPEWR